MIAPILIILLFIPLSFYIQLDNIKRYAYIYENRHSLVIYAHSGDVVHGVKTCARLETDKFRIIVDGIVDNYYMWGISKITYIDTSSSDVLLKKFSYSLSADIYFPIQYYYQRRIQHVIYEKILYEKSDPAKRKAMDREKQLEKLGI